MVDQRRDLLVRSAFLAIARRGFEGLRLREVALAAEIDHSTIHHYFRTKQDLVAAVVSYATGQFGQTLSRDGTAGERLHDHFRVIARLIHDQPDLFTVMNEIQQHALRDAGSRTAVEAQQKAWRGALVELFRAGAGDGSWTVQFDPDVMATLVIATMQGINQSPEQAGAVLDQLEALLSGPVPPGPDRQSSS